MVGELAAICKQLKLSDLTKLASQVAFENEIQYLTDVLRLALKNVSVKPAVPSSSSPLMR